jgi:CRP-like cAMP-binding protein
MTETWAAITPARERDSLLLADAADKMSASMSAVLKEAVAPTPDDRPPQRYEKGETIPLYPQLLWQVQQGLVKLHTLTEDNEEVLLGLVGPSTPFGLGSTFLPVYQATAMTSVELLQFSLAEVKAIPDLAQTLLPKLNQRLHQTEALLTIAGQRRVKYRLCLLLRLLQQEIGEPVAQGTRLSLRLTHEDLASACCTTRVTVTRLMGELQKQGELMIDSKCHIILKENF